MHLARADTARLVAMMGKEIVRSFGHEFRALRAAGVCFARICM
jgi:hypothetical protein